MKYVFHFLGLLAISATVIAAPQQDDASFKTAVATSTSPPPVAATIDARAAASGFVHPGIFVDSSRLSFMASKVASHAQPWSSAYASMMAHPYASRVTPTPYATVECGPTSTPDIGCTAEREDALAAYLNALSWVVTKDQSKADRAITFMNAWAKTIKAHTNSNGPLQAAWSAADWVRTAEIIRYTNAGWDSSDITAFENMLRNVYLPKVVNGSTNPNNWDLVLMEAKAGIAVFLDDQATYEAAITRFIRSAAQYIYLESDGSRPVLPEGMTEAKQDWWWNGQIQRGLANGIGMEVCRDLTHTSYGLASISHVLETSRIQGQDLYGEDTGTRLRYGLEFHTTYDRNGGAVAVPAWLCNGTLNLQLEDVSEPGYTAFRGNYDLPYTTEFTLNVRPAGADTLFIGWETLTHAT